MGVFLYRGKLLHVNILGEIGLEFLSIYFRRNVLDGIGFSGAEWIMLVNIVVEFEGVVRKRVCVWACVKRCTVILIIYLFIAYI